MVLLKKYGEPSWASGIEGDLYFVLREDAYGAKRFLSYFGGMGSLNDLVLCPAQEVGDYDGEGHRNRRSLLQEQG